MHGCFRDVCVTGMVAERTRALFETCVALACCPRSAASLLRRRACSTRAYVLPLSRTKRCSAADKSEGAGQMRAEPGGCALDRHASPRRCCKQAAARRNRTIGTGFRFGGMSPWRHPYPRQPGTDTLPSRKSAKISTRRFSTGYRNLISSHSRRAPTRPGGAWLVRVGGGSTNCKLYGIV